MCLQIVVWIVCEMEELEKLDVFTNCGLNCLWNGKKFNGFVEFHFNYFWNGKREKKCISSIETHGVICMSNLSFWFCVMYHLYNVTSQLGPCLWHTLADGTCMCVAINGDHAIPPIICSKEKKKSFENLPRSFIYIVL